MEPRVGEYVWLDSESRQQIPPIFTQPFNLPTAKAAIFQGILMTGFMLVAIVFKVYQVTLDGPCSNLTVLLFAQGTLWIISFVLHLHYSWNHFNLRIFSVDFDQRSSVIFFILSCWNAITLVYLAASIKYARPFVCDWEYFCSALNLTVYSICAQGFLLLIAIYRYVRIVMNFNHWNPVPEAIIAQAMSLSRSHQEDAVRASDEQMRRFVTQQAYLIDFYRNILMEMSRETGRPRVDEQDLFADLHRTFIEDSSLILKTEMGDLKKIVPPLEVYFNMDSILR